MNRGEYCPAEMAREIVDGPVMGYGGGTIRVDVTFPQKSIDFRRMDPTVAHKS